MEKLLVVFGLSFITALTGAMQPGPLLTYTILQSLKTPRRGYLTGARIIAGHAVIEIVIIISILYGLSAILTNEIIVKIIGIAGTLFLLLLAVLVLRDVFIKKVDLPNSDAALAQGQKGFFKNVYVGGALISMSNPFWWIWWATLGFYFMREYDVSLSNIPLVISFYLGHELADLGWYSLVSSMVYTGRRWLNRKRYHILLCATAVLLAGFAVFLFISSMNYKG